MTQPTTAGISLNSGRKALDQAVELLSSMRFSISLLMVVAAASVVGTVVEQNKPWVNYVNQFGVFWAEIFQTAGVFSVYNTTWFLVVMAFLVLSLVLCITRNTGPMLREMRSFKDRMGRAGVLAHKHRGHSLHVVDVASTQAAVQAHLKQAGYSIKVQPRENGAVMIAAKKGTQTRWGYLLAHSAMVVILLGGLLDSELPLRLLAMLRGSVPVVGSQLISSVPESGRLPVGNISYRANVLIPEGSTSRNAVVNYKDGVLVQPIPFDLTLKRFNIEYYPTGMPKLFTSDVVVTDFETGQSFERKIIVNEPLSYKGVTIYQSSFDDGGSVLQLKVYPILGNKTYDFALTGTVGESSSVVSDSGVKYTVEYSAYRPINVEDFSKVGEPVPTQDALKTVLGAPAPSQKSLRNVGPSVQYKLRDASGQAKEFHAYQLPVTIEGQSVLLLGMRETAAQAFKYVRIPADEQGGIVEYMRLRAALANPDIQRRAAAAFAARSLKPEQVQARQQLQTSAEKALSVFAGVSDTPVTGTPTLGGFAAIAALIEKNVSQDQAEQAANVIVKVLTGAAWDVWQQARVQAGLKPLQGSDAQQAFLQQALTAYSDSFFIGAPFMLQLESAEHKQASVFQVTRSPGQYTVYTGALMLVLGVFAMFYVRERRLWVWLTPIPIPITIPVPESAPAGASHAVLPAVHHTQLDWALSAPKLGLAFNAEYAHWQAVLGDKASSETH